MQIFYVASETYLKDKDNEIHVYYRTAHRIPFPLQHRQKLIQTWMAAIGVLIITVLTAINMQRLCKTHRKT